MALVEDELARLVKFGFLNDTAYARGKARSLLRRGNGLRLVGTKLRQKGVPSEVIDAVLAEVEAELGVDPNQLSAALYARKRRMGPWARPPRGDDGPEARRVRRQRDLQRMARAGFSYDLARGIVDVTPGSPEAEELEELVHVRRSL